MDLDNTTFTDLTNLLAVNHTTYKTTNSTKHDPHPRGGAVGAADIFKFGGQLPYEELNTKAESYLTDRLEKKGFRFDEVFFMSGDKVWHDNTVGKPAYVFEVKVGDEYHYEFETRFNSLKVVGVEGLVVVNG